MYFFSRFNLNYYNVQNNIIGRIDAARKFLTIIDLNMHPIKVSSTYVMQSCSSYINCYLILEKKQGKYLYYMPS